MKKLYKKEQLFGTHLHVTEWAIYVKEKFEGRIYDSEIEKDKNL